MDEQILKTINSLSLSSGLCQRNAQKKLDSWFNESMKLLRDTYHNKTCEINNLFEMMKKNLDDYKHRQVKSIGKQHRDLLMQELDLLKSEISTLIEVQSVPGTIHDLQVFCKVPALETPTIYSSLRHTLQRTVPVQSYRFSSSCRAMACNSKTDEILLYEKDELILYHVNGTLGGSVSWSTSVDGFVSDIVWCSKLDCFLVLGRLALSAFNTYLYTSTRIETIQATQSQYFIAIAYVEQSSMVFICCHDSKEMIRQYGPLPSWNLQKAWSREAILEKDDAGARCIRVSPSGTCLGLVIKTKSDQFRIALYSTDFTELLFTVPIIQPMSPSKGSRCNDFMLYLTPFLDDRWWLVVYGNGIHEHSLLLVDGYTGKLETIINEAILNICMLDEQYLIVRMKQSMFIYDSQ